MQSAKRFVPLALLTIGFFAGCWFGKSPEPAQAQGAAAKWEHKFFTVTPSWGADTSECVKKMTEQLAEADAGGWEYAGFTTRQSQNSRDNSYLLFRRPKR